MPLTAKCMHFCKKIFYFLADNFKKNKYTKQCIYFGGEGEIRTPAPLSRPTPLAGAPLRPA